MDALRALAADLRAALGDLFHWVESFADKPYGGTALFVFALAESSFFPIPPDVLLIPLCLGDPPRAFWFAAICTAGSVVGGACGYGLGYWGGRPLVRRMFRAERVAAVERLYDRYNAWATGIAGLTPLPYKLFTVSGGAFAIDFKIFMLASVVSRGLRFFAVAGLLYVFGEPIRDFIDDNLGWLTIAFVILLVLGFWLTGKGLGRAGRSPRGADGAVRSEDAPADGGGEDSASAAARSAEGSGQRSGERSGEVPDEESAAAARR
jgi:membrane protein YqaA with SNARE-associated domain